MTTKRLLLTVILLWVTGWLELFGQTKTIKGRIFSSADLKGIAGVNIVQQGKRGGVYTDSSGLFTLTVQDGIQLISLTHISYLPQTLPLDGKTFFEISMLPAESSLDSVVVIGYGSVRRKDLTGSVAEVNMKDMLKAPVKSFDEALAGRVAGVAVSGNDGQPGAVNNIVIRGSGSITQDNSPLYIVDGFPLEDGMNNSLNPADIESINVLKDASATAIYGARGANGVIIITTRKGQQGAPVVNFNMYYGAQKLVKRVDMLDPYEFVKYQVEVNPSIANQLYFSNGQTLDSYKNTEPLDLQDYIYRTASIQNYSLSLRGGNDKTKYAVSGNAFTQQGLVLNSGFQRYQGRLNLEQTINTKIRAIFNVNYSYSKAFGVSPAEQGLNTSFSNNLFYAVWGYRPIAGNGDNLIDDLIDPALDGNLYGDYRVNPVVSVKNQLYNQHNTNLLANAAIEYKILPELTLRISGGVTNVNIRDEAFYNSQTSRGSKYNSFGVNGYIYTSPRTNLLNENTLTYRKSYKGGHNLTAVAGYSQQVQRTARSGFSATQVPNESLGLDGLDQSSSIGSSSSSSRWGLLSLLGRANYSYKSRYLFTASFRSDGSSKFQEGKRWGYFPSASVAWNMTKEKFFANLPVISESKLRLSYGTTGNNRISDFGYLSQITLGPIPGYSYNNTTTATGAQLSAMGNPDLKWETTKQVNIGYDLGLWNNRVTVTADVYRKTTDDLLLLANLPYTTGVGSAFKNIGRMKNEGLELTVNTVNIRNKDFSWRTSFNISFNKNEILELTENQQEILSSVFFDFSYNSLFAYTAQIGHPVAQMRGYLWDGVYQFTDFDESSPGVYVLKATVPANGTARANIKPGDIKYRDLNGDLVVDASDITTIGRGIPKHTGGFSNDFTYKNFDLNIFFQWSYGNDLLNANRLVFEGNAKNFPNLNQFASWIDRWQPDNPSNTLFRTGGQGPYAYSSRIIEDGSYLRLKTVSFGYTLDEKFTKKMKIQSLRLYMSAQNLLTLTNYSGPDPEVSIRNSNLTPGFDYSAYPRPRVITLGLDLTF